MFFTKKRNSLNFYKKWYLPVISAITVDGENSYDAEDVKNKLIPRLEKIELYLQPGLLKEWNLSNIKEKQKLIHQIKTELLNPVLL